MEIEMEEGNKSRVLPAALGTLIPSLKECRKRVLQMILNLFSIWQAL